MVELTVAAVEADIVRRFRRGVAVGDDDVRQLVAVDVGHRGIARRPFRTAVGTGLVKTALAIVEINALRIRRVVTDHHIEIAIAIEIHQVRRVRLVGDRSEIVSGGKGAASVTDEHAIDEVPMPTLGEHDVEMPVTIHVADMHVRGVLGCRFQEENAVEPWKR